MERKMKDYLLWGVFALACLFVVCLVFWFSKNEPVEYYTPTGNHLYWVKP